MSSVRMPGSVRLLVALVLLSLAAVTADFGRAAEAQLPAVGLLDLTVEELTTDVVDPTVVEVAGDGTVVIAERKGAVKLVSPEGVQMTAGTIGVSANQCSECPAEAQALEEGGLHGMVLYPDFPETGRLLAYYSVPGSLGTAPITPVHPEAGGDPAEEGIFRLSRFTITDGVLDLDGEEVLLENPTEWYECCHYGGDLEWMADGTLVMSTGDDTNPHSSNGFSPHDAREGRDAFNAMRTSANPADRRGKILRIDVDDLDGDGSLVPGDNPHVGDPAYDPYVYAMGFRSNYRIDVDPGSQAIIVGNVGPDAQRPDAARGPEGHDEVEVVPPGGGTDHGWPRCIGAAEPYVQRADFEADAPGEAFDCSDTVPAQVHYTYAPDPLFPTMAHGVTRTAIAGPVYRYDGEGEHALPEAYQGNFLMLEFSRSSMVTVPFDGAELDTTQMLPAALGTLTSPIDATVGPDGAVYVAEYGAGFYNATGGAVSRIVPGGPTDALPSAQAEGPGTATPVLLAGAAVLVLVTPARRRDVV